MDFENCLFLWIWRQGQENILITGSSKIIFYANFTGNYVLNSLQYLSHIIKWVKQLLKICVSNKMSSCFYKSVNITNENMFNL